MSGILSCTPSNSSKSQKDGKDENEKKDFFSPIGGVYKSQQLITISPEKGETVYYTLDGSTPTENSLKYAAPFTLNTPSLVRALAINGDKKRYIMTMYDFDLQPDAAAYTSSPVWTDQIIYFLLLDKFYNADTSNDDLGYGEKSVNDKTWFSGGDFAGLEAKLDYIKNLGATAIWITPPIKNQWSEGSYGGSHGYWASDFMNVDPHYGDLTAYKSLVDAAHSKGLYVIQDIVLNHVGDYFTINSSPLIPGKDMSGWSLKSGSKPFTYPEQLPWKFNDPRIFTEDELKNNSFYNWTPPISDYNIKTQVYTYQLSNLDDINTDNKVVQNLLRGYFRYWIDKVDIDGYRVDTVKYIDPSFFEDFVNSNEAGNKGIRTHAADLGKNDFILFGECWDSDEALNVSYTAGDNGEKRLDSLIYFTLNFAVREVFGSGKPTSEFTKVLNIRETAGYADPKKLVTFVDNHDMERLINVTSESRVKQAYAFLMTIPGIPQLYYGTEQGFSVQRKAMFKGGYSSDGTANTVDYFQEDGEWFKYIQSLTKLRRENSVFRNGKMSILKDNSNNNGIFAYKMVEGEGGIGKEALVVFNTSGSALAAIDMNCGFNAGDKFDIIQPSSDSLQKSVTADNNGNITLAVPAESFGIYILTSEKNNVEANENSIKIISAYDITIESFSMTVSGILEKSADIRVFVNGNYASSIAVSAGLTWETQIDLTSVSNGTHEAAALIDTGDVSTYIYSSPVTFTLKKPFIEAAYITDPQGDDKGPNGNYTLPKDPSFTSQQDILSAKVSTSGSDIKIDLIMGATTNTWKPNTNDFDHVVFHIFIADGKSDTGIKAMPFLNSNVPDDMGTWNYYARMTGWTSAMTNSNGTFISPAPASVVNHNDKTVTFNISGKSLGSPASLNGWKIYISTWDEDTGIPREISLAGGDWIYGGADGASKPPLIMDDISVITID